ncbi:hypothetical protein PHYBLDRAFT_67474 [Phycomyces blakesleeanus NRRL 1555(-)]|uniref:Uncharacterized protein n=1 Tax=Phycomyces blakesleeanus (strain ATCC 8743b / DSM 1359 / FGSC 10004 / NBRC 33097 / NRRL 1555) TaxID=763407 RepID=A0A162U9N4_PHYB8|nr:hypothetical protein PHYBLDRAFT_67474 [Phycomyces blakesleeanus NRRL 1555(-)]OAD74612.1 hypothetical protein PHYBLDRAFT_67474 [Phycomyces blakesleeanus NRRL 1555(-)]|eukprot:XP_018292652.1 hypothetical protein PHYBLDRAFT_67474 [Phycomyces blakesleeanus NRRL 1555(-)]
MVNSAIFLLLCPNFEVIYVWKSVKNFDDYFRLHHNVITLESIQQACLLRKDLVSKFDKIPTLNYYCYLYYFGLEKLYAWGQKIIMFVSYNYAPKNALMYRILW